MFCFIYFQITIFNWFWQHWKPKNVIKGITTGKKMIRFILWTRLLLFPMFLMLSFPVRRKERNAPLVFSRTETWSNKPQLICKPCFSNGSELEAAKNRSDSRAGEQRLLTLNQSLLMTVQNSQSGRSAAPHSEQASPTLSPTSIQLIFFTAGLIISSVAGVAFKDAAKITFIIDRHPPKPQHDWLTEARWNGRQMGWKFSFCLQDERGAVRKIWTECKCQVAKQFYAKAPMTGTILMSRDWKPIQNFFLFF